MTSILFVALLATFINHVQCFSFGKSHFPNGIEGGAPPVVIKGYKMFNQATGEHIIVKGVDYYPRPNRGKNDWNSVDFYTTEYKHVWERDIVEFKALGLNAIRLYAVDPDNDHSDFMCALNKAGIYVMVGLASSCPNCEIGQNGSENPKCYPPELKTRGERIIREFSRYTNTLAFSAGNEVNLRVPLGSPASVNAPCLKKFIRDMRAFVDGCGKSSLMRHVPIGLIIADLDREANAKYYNCRTDPNDELESAEWYGINSYVSCDPNVTEFDHSLGFRYMQKDFKSYDYSIPVLMTEFGCLNVVFPTIDGYEGQRTFYQARWLGLPQVQESIAGGFVFEYSIERSIANMPYPFKMYGPASYGIGYFSPEMCDDVNLMCDYNPTPEFYNLKKSFQLAQPTLNVTLDNFVPTESRTKPSKCPWGYPDLDSFEWPSDDQSSISCPAKDESAYTCPKQIGADTNVDNTTTGFSAVALLALLSIASIAFIAIFYWNRKNKKKSSFGDEGEKLTNTYGSLQ